MQYCDAVIKELPVFLGGVDKLNSMDENRFRNLHLWIGNIFLLLLLRIFIYLLYYLIKE